MEYKLLEKHAYFIYSIGILPDYQNNGYGTKLLSFIKNSFFEIFVLTYKGNVRAYHVYEKLGGKNDYEEDEICYVYNLKERKKMNIVCDDLKIKNLKHEDFSLLYKWLTDERVL